MSRQRRRGFMVHYTSAAQAVAYTRIIRDLNGNTIRWQINGNFGANATPVDLTTEAGYYTWLNGHLTMIETAIAADPQLFKDVKIVLDLHHTFRAGSTQRSGWLARKEGRRVFLDTWKMIATRFKGVGQVLAYDLVNEPRYTNHTKYSNFLTRVCKAIRKIDGKKPIMISCKLGRPKQMRFLQPIKNVSKVWYTVHFYEAGFITYQGVIDPLTNNPRKYPTRNVNKALLKKLLKPVKDFQDKYGVRIFVGEFSCSRFSGYPSHLNAKHWFADTISIWEEYKWDWCMHAFRESQVWDQELPHNPSDYITRSFDTPPMLEIINGLAKNR